MERDELFRNCEPMQCADRDDWLSERRNSIGASESAALFDVSPWLSPFALYVAKTEAPANHDVPEWMKWGLLLEPAIAQGYANETGRKLVDVGQWTILRRKDTPEESCTLDFLIDDPQRGPAPLQVKNASAFTADHFRDGAPLHYAIQLQQEMDVLGASWGSLGVLVGGNKLEVIDVEYDPHFADTLRNRLRHFWKEHIEMKLPPAIDGDESTVAALKELFPEAIDDTIMLPEVSAQWYEERQLVVDQMKALEDRKRALENQFRDALGSTKRGIIPGVGAVSYPTINKAERVQTVKATSYRQFYFPRSVDPAKATKEAQKAGLL